MKHARLVIGCSGFAVLAFLLAGCRVSGNDSISVSIQVQVPCTDTLYLAPIETPKAKQPYLISEPRCGDLAPSVGVKGSSITLTGSGFRPNEAVEIFWKDHTGEIYHPRKDGLYLKVPSDKNGNFQMIVSLPFAPNLPKEEKGTVSIWELVARQGKFSDRKTQIDIEVIKNHLITSVVGMLVGGLLGGGLGYAIARGLYTVNLKVPRLGSYLVLFPWRAVAMSILIMLLWRIPIVMLLGFGRDMDVISVSASICLLSLVGFTSVFLGNWCPPSTHTQLLSYARTMATAAVMFGTILNLEGGGIGLNLIEYMIRLLEHETAKEYLAILLLIMLAFDLLLGIPHFFSVRKDERARQKPIEENA